MLQLEIPEITSLFERQHISGFGFNGTEFHLFGAATLTIIRSAEGMRVELVPTPTVKKVSALEVRHFDATAQPFEAVLRWVHEQHQQLPAHGIGPVLVVVANEDDLEPEQHDELGLMDVFTLGKPEGFDAASAKERDALVKAKLGINKISAELKALGEAYNSSAVLVATAEEQRAAIEYFSKPKYPASREEFEWLQRRLRGDFDDFDDE